MTLAEAAQTGADAEPEQDQVEDVAVAADAVVETSVAAGEVCEAGSPVGFSFFLSVSCFLLIN